MFVKRISHLVELASFNDDWNRLSGSNPFVSWDWLSSWWTHYGTEHDLFVLVVLDKHEHVVGLAPWFLESSTARGRRVKFLGSGHVCSDYLRILTHDDDMDDVTSAIAVWLKEANDKSTEHDEVDGWDFLSFDGVRMGEPSLIRLRENLEALGHQSDDEPTPDCWRIELGRDWNAFLRRLPKKKRRNLRNIRKTFIDAGRTEFAYAKDKQQFADFYETFVELHQRRRESLGDVGCFASTEFAGFLRDVASHFFRRGELLVSRLSIDGDLAAGSLGFLSNGIHYMYQTGMNPDVCERTPGWVMNVHHILYGYDNNIRAIDFLRGDEPYKSRLGSDPIEMVKFRIVANQTGAKVRNRFWQLRTSIQQNGLPLLGFEWGDFLGSESPHT